MGFFTIRSGDIFCPEDSNAERGNESESNENSSYREPIMNQLLTVDATPLRTTVMTTFKAFALATFVSAMAASSVFAQAAVQEPGEYAFFHPNSDVLNAGAPRPEGALAFAPAGNAYAAVEGASPSSCAQRHRSYDAASGTFSGRDGRRHSCD
jgi:hypothetical protein